MRLFLFLLMLTGAILCQGQTPQSEYLEAKRLFNNKDYVSARAAFAALFSHNAFGPYAIFFGGLSAYYEGDKAAANSIWQQLINRFPDWENRCEVYYWMAISSFEQEKLEEAIRLQVSFNRHCESLIIDEIAHRYLRESEKEVLEELLRRFPDNRQVAESLASQLSYEDPAELARLEQLTNQFDLAVSSFGKTQNPWVRKEKYAIAVLLPFMFEGLQDVERTVNNQVIMDLYQGMLLGAEEINKYGEEIRLYPYDTQRNSRITQAVLQNPSLMDADLILGPLFGGPIQAAADFSQSNAINMFNPVSSNGDVIKESDYAFLLKPSFATMAVALANHAVENISNKNALIYYENSSRDSLFAHEYHNVLVKNGFEVIEFKVVDNEASKEILDSLTVQHEELIYSLAEVDSLMELPGRFIKSREPDEERESEKYFTLVRENEDGSQGDSLIYYEMKYNVVEDSIGHIMIASRDNGIVNNLIGALENRPDTIGLFGYGNWLNFPIVDFDQIERLEVAMAIPDFIDKHSDSYREVYDKALNTYQGVPSDYHFLGYETILYVGEMLRKYGKYFQNGFIQQGLKPGQTTLGYRYSFKNDNQVVPIVTLRNNRLVPYDLSDDQ